MELYRYTRFATPLPCPEAMTTDALATYETDGYLAIADLFEPDEVTIAQKALADLVYERVPGFGRTEGGSPGLQPEAAFREKWHQLTPDVRVDAIRKVWRFVEFEPRLHALAYHPRLLAVLEMLLSEPVQLIQDMALLKPPLVGGEKPWHQDAAYFVYAPPEKVVGVWIALHPATVQNGCMHVLPGTHREGAVPHVHARDCQIPDTQVQGERDVVVPLEPGGALIFSSLLHHGTPPNHSADRRWALQFHYAARSCYRLSNKEPGMC